MNNDVYILFTIIIGLCDLFEIISLCIHELSITLTSRFIILIFLYISEHYFKNRKKNKDRLIAIHYILYFCISDIIISLSFCILIYINIYSITVCLISMGYVLYEYDNIYYSDNLKRILVYNYIKNQSILIYNRIMNQKEMEEQQSSVV
jgi:hypothetical protein